MRQIVHNDLGHAKNLVAAAVTTLGDFEDALIGLREIVPHKDSLLPVRIEGLPRVVCGLYAVAVEELAQLLQRHRHTAIHRLGGKGTFEIVDNRQQV